MSDVITMPAEVTETVAAAPEANNAAFEKAVETAVTAAMKAMDAPPPPKKQHVSKEMQRHVEQIQNRSRSRERNLFGLLSFSSSAGVKALEFERDLMPLGEMTHFVLRRRWKRTRQGYLVAIQYAGYKSRLTDEGRIVLGGPQGQVCAYDLKYPPFDKASPGGVIIDARKRTTLRLGLDLDAAVEIVAQGQAAPSLRLQIPDYYAAFRPEQIGYVDPEITPHTRRCVLESLRPSYDGPAHPCTVCNRDGVIEEVVADEAADVRIVKLAGDDMMPELKFRSVLRPWVQPGVEVKAGTVLGDILPRAVYNSWEQCVRTFGEPAMEFAARQTILARDFHHRGLVLRDVRFCPNQLGDALQIFERAPNVDHTKRAAVQVICEDGQGRNGLRFEEGPITVDLETLREGWSKKFTG